MIHVALKLKDKPGDLRQWNALYRTLLRHPDSGPETLESIMDGKKAPWAGLCKPSRGLWIETVIRQIKGNPCAPTVFMF